MDDFRAFILDWLERRGWSQARLAEASEISQSLISKYLTDDARKRVTPFPGSLEKLAPVVGVSYEDLMRMCGYLHDPPGQLGDQDDIENDVNARVAELMTAVRGMPEWAWTTIIRATFDRALSDIAEWGQMIPPAPPEDRALPTRADRERHERAIGRSPRRQRPMKPRDEPMLVGALG